MLLRINLLLRINAIARLFAGSGHGNGILNALSRDGTLPVVAGGVVVVAVVVVVVVVAAVAAVVLGGEQLTFWSRRPAVLR